MVHHDQGDEQDQELREAQEGTGYGEDEGERDEALEPEGDREPVPSERD